MFIEKAYKAKNEFWRYILGWVFAIIASFLGQIPWMIAIFMKGGLAPGMNQNESMQLLNSNLNVFLMLLSFLFGLIGLFLVIRFFHRQKIKEVTTSREKIDWSRVFFGFSLVGIFIIVFTGIDYYLHPEDYVLNFQLVPFLILCAIAVVLIPIQTSFEEYLFRGYLMQGFGILAKNRWVPLVVTSVIFGMLHFFNPEVAKMGNIIMVYYIGTGFLLGIMTLMDEGMELSLGFHAGNNLVGALLVTADWTAFQTNSVLKDVSEPAIISDILLPVLIVYPLFLYIMAKKYRWNNWKEKLFGKVEAPEEFKEIH